MAFIRNVDKLIEGLENKFFTEARAKAALAPELASEESARLAGDSAEAAARQAADDALDARLDVIEGSGEGSVAKAEQDAKDYADQKVADLVNSAPAVLDTLKELSDALGGDENFAATVAGQIGAVDGKVDQEILDRQSAVSAEQSARELADQALDGRLDLLEADSVTKAYVDGEVSDLQGQITQEISDRQGAVSAEESARQSADNALSGRISVLEQDPTTKAYVDGEVLDLQGQITQEISDRQGAVSAEESRAMSAESALDGRLDIIEGADSVEGSVAKAEKDAKDYADSLDSAMDARVDVLEQDPTTKTYVDGEVLNLQVQIDQEISDRQADVSILEGSIYSEQSRAESAEQALDVRLAILEQDPTTKAYVDGEVSNLQGQVDVEKGRIDAILSAADADKDSFAEIVSLINSVDTSNDNAFASYVLSNDAALAQEVSDRQAGDSALDLRLDVLEADPTTKTYVDGQISSEASARSSADVTLQSNIDAEASARTAADLLMFKLDGSRNMTGNILFQNNGVNNIGSAPTGVSILKNDYTNRPQNIMVTGRVVGSRFSAQAFSSSNTTPAQLDLGRARGTEASPTNVQQSDILGSIGFWGRLDSGTPKGSARIRATAEQNYLASSATSASFDFEVTSKIVNSTTLNTVVHIEPSGTYISGETSSGTFEQILAIQNSGNPYTNKAGIVAYKEFTLSAGIKLNATGVFANYTVLASDYVIGVYDVSASRVITLPSASSVGGGKTYIVKDTSGQASQPNYIQIAPQSGQLIDGQSDYKIVMPYESVTLITDGFNWYIL